MQPAVSIVGAGTTGVGKFGDRSAISLASEAVDKALADAGMDRKEVNGLVSHIGFPRGIDYDLAAARLGLTVDFSAQPWSHGRFGATVIQHAAMAISSGLADVVLCLAAYRNTPSGTVGGRAHVYFDESMRDGGGPHAETPHAGLSAPVAGAALAARRYFHKYAVDPSKLSAVPLAMRGHAQLNPGAAIRKPLSETDYRGAPFIVEPLRLFDCSVVVDGAVALVLARDDRAADTANTPVRILGMQGLSAGPNAYIFGQPGLGVNDASLFDYEAPAAADRVYRMAGVTPADIDFLQVYDAFSPLVLLTLERFGFCGAGEAADWVQGGRIAPGGALPINTSGGMLSEGHLNGWNQFFETVAQMRHQAGDRQVSNAQIAQWGTALGDSIIFGRSR